MRLLSPDQRSAETRADDCFLPVTATIIDNLDLCVFLATQRDYRRHYDQDGDDNKQQFFHW